MRVIFGCTLNDERSETNATTGRQLVEKRKRKKTLPNFSRLHIKIFNCYQMRITIRHRAEKWVRDVISYLSRASANQSKIEWMYLYVFGNRDWAEHKINISGERMQNAKSTNAVNFNENHFHLIFIAALELFFFLLEWILVFGGRSGTSTRPAFFLSLCINVCPICVSTRHYVHSLHKIFGGFIWLASSSSAAAASSCWPSASAHIRFPTGTAQR